MVERTGVDEDVPWALDAAAAAGCSHSREVSLVAVAAADGGGDRGRRGVRIDGSKSDSLCLRVAASSKACSTSPP